MKKLGFYNIKPFPHIRYSKDIYGWDGVAQLPVNKDKFIVVWFQNKTGNIKVQDRKLLYNFCIQSGEKGLLSFRVKRKVKYAGKRKGSYATHKIIFVPIGFRLEGDNIETIDKYRTYTRRKPQIRPET